jgi:four helix bundle protein
MQDLKSRTKAFALAVIRVTDGLPATRKAQRIADQVFRSGTSVGAHYREAMRAKSNADFISKLEGALQELEETAYWLELLVGSNLIAADDLLSLQDEANQLIAIIVTMVKNTKAKNGRPRLGSRTEG